MTTESRHEDTLPRSSRVTAVVLPVVLLVVIGAACALRLPAAAATAVPPGRAGPVRCELSAYVSDLYDIDPAKGRFSARLWLWTICPDKSADPLPKISYANADDPNPSEPNIIEQDGHVLDQVRVQSSFRQEWDVRNFPFDRHRIEIVLTAPQDTNHFRFAVNNADAQVNPEIRPEGWRVTGFRLVSATKHYTTTYGDHSLKDGSTYDRVRIRIDLERSSPTIFWKLTIPLYLAVLIAVSTFLISSRREELETTARLDGVYNRLGVLGGGLFVVVLNMQQANDVITSPSGLTLIDWLHLATLAFLLLAVAATVLAWSWTSRGGSPTRAEHVGHRGAWLGLAAYVVVCGTLVLLAARG
ncbi:hypothetical protein B7P34_27910 [Streptosporangium nondiastaticum]|uniref:Uncharacterized protein n=1 Tax=Streptosporangium nondiastaticum TaxID=35764 RepID=A0A9X7PF55_9ACTN|nr:hypothetical protein [Streptosporangium nondiastaticum]PSJ25496.1 hypothetical protein B7P34_27910 [Streptosporangium nondiastaticum]